MIGAEPLWPVRLPSGLDQDSPAAFCKLEARQGDEVSGKVSRLEVARVVGAALDFPSAVGKTFEVRVVGSLAGPATREETVRSCFPPTAPIRQQRRIGPEKITRLPAPGL